MREVVHYSKMNGPGGTRISNAPRPPPRQDSLLLRGDDSGVATSADAPSCSGDYDDEHHDHDVR